MEREKLKQILLNFYSIAMIDMILRGARKPSYETICELNKKFDIPFDVWLDIKSFINNTKDKSSSTTTL
ncbi:MAG: hypothetical protein PHG81_05610 [Aliarcobacter sp.]|jgi:transcriptional regulator with XRE-family HTH domain|nr:hypothetical protein [Aliarcobacter sp.]